MIVNPYILKEGTWSPPLELWQTSLEEGKKDVSEHKPGHKKGSREKNKASCTQRPGLLSILRSPALLISHGEEAVLLCLKGQQSMCAIREAQEAMGSLWETQKRKNEFILVACQLQC